MMFTFTARFAKGETSILRLHRESILKIAPFAKKNKQGGTLVTVDVHPGQRVYLVSDEYDALVERLRSYDELHTFVDPAHRIAQPKKSFNAPSRHDVPVFLK